MRSLYLFICWCLCCSVTAYAAEDKALFWEVTSDSTSIALLGSIHFADDSFYPLRKDIIDRFDAADHLVVELDITRIEPKRYLALINRYGRYPQGITLSDQVSESTYQRLQQVLHQFGLPPQSMDSSRPGMVVMNLLSRVLVRLGYSADKGIDLALLKRAQADDKSVLQLETLEQQIKMFASLPESDLFLSESLDDVGVAAQEMAQLEAAWKSGDTAKLEQMFITEPEQTHERFRDINEVILYRRNREMFAELERYLTRDEQLFVVVGAAHLLGEQGIVTMLKQAGYEVVRR